VQRRFNYDEIQYTDVTPDKVLNVLTYGLRLHRFDEIRYAEEKLK